MAHVLLQLHDADSRLRNRGCPRMANNPKLHAIGKQSSPRRVDKPQPNQTAPRLLEANHQLGVADLPGPFQGLLLGRGLGSCFCCFLSTHCDSSSLLLARCDYHHRCCLVHNLAFSRPSLRPLDKECKSIYFNRVGASSVGAASVAILYPAVQGSILSPGVISTPDLEPSQPVLAAQVFHPVFVQPEEFGRLRFDPARLLNCRLNPLLFERLHFVL